MLRPCCSLAVMSLPGQGQSSAQLCSRGPPPALAALLQTKLPLQATGAPAGKGLLPSPGNCSAHIMSGMRVNEGAGPSAGLLMDPSGLTSSRGRVVKPRQWDDGTEAAPPSGEPCMGCSCTPCTPVLLLKGRALECLSFKSGTLSHSH